MVVRGAGGCGGFGEDGDVHAQVVPAVGDGDRGHRQHLRAGPGLDAVLPRRNAQAPSTPHAPPYQTFRTAWNPAPVWPIHLIVPCVTPCCESCWPCSSASGRRCAAVGRWRWWERRAERCILRPGRLLVRPPPPLRLLIHAATAALTGSHPKAANHRRIRLRIKPRTKPLIRARRRVRLLTAPIVRRAKARRTPRC